MKWKLTSPEGEAIEATVTEGDVKICHSSSKQVCNMIPEGEEGLKIAMERLWHEGWRIEQTR